MVERIKPPVPIPGQSPDDPRFKRFRQQPKTPEQLPAIVPGPEKKEERKGEPDKDSPHKIDKTV